jgi:hypothetical protein
LFAPSIISSNVTVCRGTCLVGKSIALCRPRRRENLSNTRKYYLHRIQVLKSSISNRCTDIMGLFGLLRAQMQYTRARNTLPIRLAAGNWAHVYDSNNNNYTTKTRIIIIVRRIKCWTRGNPQEIMQRVRDVESNIINTY